jgi:hypothetical protein
MFVLIKDDEALQLVTQNIESGIPDKRVSDTMAKVRRIIKHFIHIMMPSHQEG